MEGLVFTSRVLSLSPQQDHEALGSRGRCEHGTPGTWHPVSWTPAPPRLQPFRWPSPCQALYHGKPHHGGFPEMWKTSPRNPVVPRALLCRGEVAEQGARLPGRARAQATAAGEHHKWPSGKLERGLERAPLGSRIRTGLPSSQEPPRPGQEREGNKISYPPDLPPAALPCLAHPPPHGH